jgi:hypothetical protein
MQRRRRTRRVRRGSWRLRLLVGGH